MNSVSLISRAVAAGCVVFALVAGQETPQTPDRLNERDLRVRPRNEAGTRRASPPRGYALVIGVAKYQRLSPEENLRFAESDADAVYRVLISQQGGAFPAENVHRLIGPQATLENIRRELEEWLPKIATEPDRVVVYFAGHGFVKNGHGYLAPWDVDSAHPDSTGYSMETLGKVLGERVKARWKVLLADACHSGKITPETTDDAIDAAVAGLPRGFLTLTATRQREKSYEDPTLSTGFGLFSYFVVQAFHGNADNSPCDGILTADELIEYVRGEVKNYARARGVSQTPTEHGDFDPNMPLGTSKSCGDAPPNPALSLGGLVIEVNMDDVQVYVDDRLVGTVTKAKPLAVPGLATGIHIIKGVRKGYEADTKEVMVVAGQERTVTLRIQYRREYKPAAVELNDRGEKYLFKRTTSINPVAAFMAARQTPEDLTKARELFTDAIKEDPKYGKAAYNLAMACQLLSDSKCTMEAFRRAIDSDATDVESRIQYAGALIESGDPDEAIRQLTEALRLDPRADVALSHLARAYLDKEVWDRTIQLADQAIAVKPQNDQAYLWKADALRRRAAGEKDPAVKKATYAQAIETYRTYLRLTNFSTPAYESFAFHFIGFGLGSRRHADRQIVYAYQRSLAFMGLCECENKLGYSQRASEYCQRAIDYDSKEPTAYFLLANAYRDLFNQTVSREYLVRARDNYAHTIRLNPDLDLSRNAKHYIEQIDQILPKLPK